MEKTFDIRPVTAQESEAILNVYRQCEDFLALGPQPRASLAMVLADLQTSADEGGCYCGIFDRQGAMIGVVDFVRRTHDADAQRAYLSLLMIDPSQRNRGLGAEAVRWVEKEIGQDERVEEIDSGVQVNNPGAIRFWQRLGYRIISGPEHLPDQTTVFHLRKRIRNYEVAHG